MKLDSFSKTVGKDVYIRRVFEIEVLVPDSKEAQDCTNMFLYLMAMYEDDIKKLNSKNKINIKENSVNGGMAIIQRKVKGKLQPIRN